MPAYSQTVIHIMQDDSWAAPTNAHVTQMILDKRFEDHTPGTDYSIEREFVEHTPEHMTGQVFALVNSRQNPSDLANWFLSLPWDYSARATLTSHNEYGTHVAVVLDEQREHHSISNC